MKKKYISVRVSDSEKEDILAMAESKGLDVSDFVRSKIFSSIDSEKSLREYESELLNYAMNSTLMLRKILYDSGKNNDVVDINEKVKASMRSKYIYNTAVK